MAEAYSSRLRGVIAEYAPTNLASYVAHTAGWRRVYQRSEYGDERQPAVKAYLERTSLVKNAAALKTPLLLVAGQNDPRIPVTETEALTKALSPRVPLWYILGTNEGHGFAQAANLKYRSLAEICFIKQYLLNQAKQERK